MPWIDTKEQFESRACDVNEQGHRTYTRYFKVYFSSLYDGPQQARVAPYIPAIKSLYTSGFDSDPAAKCTSISVQHVEPRVFGVTCSYSTDADQFENPLDRPPIISFGSAKQEIVVEFDTVTQRAIVNSAGCPFINAPTRPVSHTVITYTRNEASYDEAFARGYRDRVNAATWNGIAAKRVLCDDITAHNEIAIVNDAEFEYAVVTYVFLIHADITANNTWRKRILDQGFAYKTGFGAGERLVYPPVAEPFLLNGIGGKLENPTTATPQYRTFDVRETADFSALSITL